MTGLDAQESAFFEFLFGTSEAGALMRSREMGTQFYVVSLTEKGDLLSQWRAYAPKSGYCAGWSLNVFRKNAGINKFDLKPCIYDLELQRMTIRGILDSALQRWRTDPARISFSASFWVPRDHGQLEALAKLSNHKVSFDKELANVATTFKNAAFSEEREWRLVSHHDPSGRAPRPNFRQGRSVIIPYLEFSIDLDRFVGDDQMTKIVCGPSPEIDLAQMSAMDLFSTFGWPGTESSQSEVPYRDW
jgi:hypothetical protein